VRRVGEGCEPPLEPDVDRSGAQFKILICHADFIIRDNPV
jgi:hypothetical protein